MQIMLIPQLYSHTGTYLTLCIDVLMYSYINRKSVLIPAYDLRTQVELTFTIPIIFNLNMEILIANMFLCIHSACQQQTVNDIIQGLCILTKSCVATEIQFSLPGTLDPA